MTQLPCDSVPNIICYILHLYMNIGTTIATEAFILTNIVIPILCACCRDVFALKHGIKLRWFSNDSNIRWSACVVDWNNYHHLSCWTLPKNGTYSYPGRHGTVRNEGQASCVVVVLQSTHISLIYPGTFEYFRVELDSLYKFGSFNGQKVMIYAVWIKKNLGRNTHYVM